MLKLVALNCCTSPQSVLLQLAFIWILQPVAQTAWELYAITTLSGLKGCRFDLAYFNLILLLITNMTATFYVIFFIPYATVLFCKQARAKAEEKNRKIQNVTCLPTASFDSLKDQSQEYCVICMEDFGGEDKVSWLPCDRRHFFHRDCIMYWLIKQSQCPLCKCEVDYERA